MNFCYQSIQVLSRYLLLRKECITKRDEKKNLLPQSSKKSGQVSKITKFICLTEVNHKLPHFQKNLKDLQFGKPSFHFIRPVDAKFIQVM